MGRDLILCNLIEASKKGDAWKVIVIEEGLSKNGKYYSKKALEEAVPLFENSKVCYYEWKDNHFDHIPQVLEQIRPEGFPLQTAGVLKDVKYETVNIEGRDITGITAKMHLFNTDKIKPLRQMISEAWSKGLKNILGLSINAVGPTMMKMLNGIPVQVVEGIKKVFSTDIVSEPAAGGSLINLLESYNNKEGGNVQMFKKILEALQKLMPKVFESIDIGNVTQEEVVGVLEALDKSHKYKKVAESIVTNLKDEKLDEAQKILDAKIKETEDADNDAAKKAADADASKKAPDAEASKKAPDAEAVKKAAEDAEAAQKATDESAKALEAKMKAFEEKVAMRECKEILNDQLAESKLPQPVKDKIRKSFSGKIFKETELKESIKAERETLSKLFESANMIDLGDDGVYDFEVRHPADRLQASLDLTFGHKPEDTEKDIYKGVGEFKSLREAYVAFTDDPEIRGVMGPAALARLQEATSSTFSYALGYTINRRMLKEYKTMPETWRQIANVTKLKDFKMTEVIQWGGFGVLPTVIDARTTQGTPTDTATPSYPELGFPADTEAKYAAATKGGLVTVTRRMIINDDLKILTKMPKKIADAANMTLNQFVFDLMLNVSSGTINGGTIYDSLALYHTNHRNTQTTAFGYDALKTLLNLLWFQAETGNSTLVAEDPFSAADTTLSVTTGTGQYFKAGDKLLIDGELLRVTATSTDNLTVARGQYGTTDAQHSSGATVYKVTKFLALATPNLWVPRGLINTALELKGSAMNPESAEEAINTIKGAFDIGGGGACPYLQGDENNYYLTAKPSDVEFIEVGFINGQEAPEILIQDNPTVGNVFVYDTLRYKVRHEYGGAVVDYRGAAAGIVS